MVCPRRLSVSKSEFRLQAIPRVHEGTSSDGRSAVTSSGSRRPPATRDKIGPVGSLNTSSLHIFSSPFGRPQACNQRRHVSICIFDFGEGIKSAVVIHKTGITNVSQRNQKRLEPWSPVLTFVRETHALCYAFKSDD